jgi:magnesium-transporting ATPase (P-type)
MAKDKAPVQDRHVSGQANKALTRPAHALPADQVVAELDTNPIDGLTAGEAARRLEEYGRNEFGEDKGVQPVKILIAQIANAMTLVMPTTSSRPLSATVSSSGRASLGEWRLLTTSAGSTAGHGGLVRHPVVD